MENAEWRRALTSQRQIHEWIVMFTFTIFELFIWFCYILNLIIYQRDVFEAEWLNHLDDYTLNFQSIIFLHSLCIRVTLHFLDPHSSLLPSSLGLRFALIFNGEWCILDWLLNDHHQSGKKMQWLLTLRGINHRLFSDNLGQLQFVTLNTTSPEFYTGVTVSSQQCVRVCRR